MENLTPILLLIAAILSPVGVIITGYFAYRVAKDKNAFDKTKAILELEYAELQAECKQCRNKLSLLEKDVETFKIRVEAFGVNETKLLKELNIVEESRDDYKNKYLECLENQQVGLK